MASKELGRNSGESRCGRNSGESRCERIQANPGAFLGGELFEDLTLLDHGFDFVGWIGACFEQDPT